MGYWVVYGTYRKWIIEIISLFLFLLMWYFMLVKVIFRGEYFGMGG